MQTEIVYTIRRWDNKAPNKDKDKERTKKMNNENETNLIKCAWYGICIFAVIAVCALI